MKSGGIIWLILGLLGLLFVAAPFLKKQLEKHGVKAGRAHSISGY